MSYSVRVTRLTLFSVTCVTEYQCYCRYPNFLATNLASVPEPHYAHTARSAVNVW